MAAADSQRPRQRARNSLVHVESEGVAEVLARLYNRFVVRGRATAPTDLPATCYTLGTSNQFASVVIVLSAQWNCEPHCTLAVGTEIAVFGAFQPTATGASILLDGSGRAFYLRVPDLFVNVTALSPGFFCLRKLYFDRRFFKTGRFWEREGVLGTLKHKMFEAVVAAAVSPESEALRGRIEKEIVLQSDFFLRKSQADFDDFARAVAETVSAARAFRQKYIEESAAVLGERGDKLVVLRVAKSECGLSSARFGVKGIADLLLICRYYPNAAAPLFEEIAVPFELKTGKQKEEHRHQVMLYAAALADAPSERAFGLLFYSGNSHSAELVRVDPPTLAAMVRRRNEIAAALVRRGDPPPPIDRPFQCSNYCSQNRNCAFHLISQRARDGRFEQTREAFESDGVSVFSSIVELVEHSLADSFALGYSTRTLAAIDEEERTAANCEESEGEKRRSFTLANLFSLLLMRREHPNAPLLAAFDLFFAESELSADSPFFEHFALDKPITFRHRRHSDIALEGRIVQRHFFDAFSFSVFKLYVSLDARGIGRLETAERFGGDFYAVFSNDWTVSQRVVSNYQTMRTAVINALTDPQLRDIVSLVIGRAALAFSPPSAPSQQSLDVGEVAACMAARFELNAEQANALRASLFCERFHLIEGFCGSGKTHVLAALLCALEALGRRTLVVCHTHRALNRALEILFERIDAVRRGNVLRFVKDIASKDEFDCYSEDRFADCEEYLRLIDRSIFACTLLSLGRFRLRPNDFDFVLIDEAAQVLEPYLLIALPLGRRFVLLGDPRIQRPPAAPNSPFLESLFERLQKANPANATLLTRQYRMNAEITALANRLIYGGQLAVASQQTALQQLKLARREEAPLAAWLKELFFQHKAAVLVDSCGIEAAAGSEEAPEVLIVVEIAAALIAGGLSQNDIAVVTSTVQQKDFVVEKAKGLQNVFSLDRAAHAEAPVVVFVLTPQTVPPSRAGVLEHIHVAITRARSKLIVVGDSGKLGRHSATAALALAFLEKGQRIAPYI